MIRTGLALAMAAIVVLIMPHADHQSFSYEVNQPWHYPLLTAAFDMPILRDSASAARLKDSIDTNFVPFVKRDNRVAQENMARFSNLIQERFTPQQTRILTGALSEVYNAGIVDADIYALIHRSGPPLLRQTQTEPDGSPTVKEIDAASMLSPSKAFARIDSLYSEATGNQPLGEEGSKALNLCLAPNIITDSVVDSKFRNQEYLNVTGAMGVIKKGQRIVDIGEIITPQVYTNLNTYQEMLNQRDEKDDSQLYFSFGQYIYILICIVLLYIFLGQFRSRFFGSARKMTFLMTFLTLFVVFAIMMMENVHYGVYLVPFAAVPVIVLIFFDSRTAIFSLLMTVFMAALAATYPFTFIFMQLSAGLVAAFSIRRLTRRSQLLRAAIFSFCAYIVSYMVMLLVSDGNFTLFSWRVIGALGVNAVILSFAYILIFVIEKTFGFTSSVTLVELGDLNSPLLRRLSEEAPGTFQHSSQVSTLASEAAHAIGANADVARIGALYHDIGKLESPIFFTENQHGVNPHEGLSPEVSARKIISHVTAGLSLASKEKLPAIIRDFISEHHGRGIARYFYTTAVNENPGVHIDPDDFRYPGPNPASKETAIVMMADAVEAASRSLREYTPQTISDLVDKIVDNQVKEGRFKESPISFADVERIKDTFKRRLSTIYHTRVAYPDRKKP